MTKGKDPQRRFGWYTPRSDGSMDLAIHRVELDPKAWDEFNQIVGVIAELRPTVADYLSFVQDFSVLEGIEAELASSLQARTTPTTFVGIVLTIAYAKAQRALSNVLSAASAFRDRTLTRLTERYGDSSQDCIAFRAAIAAAYDNSFAYRVFYNLRNYAQHHASPVSLLPIKGGRGGANDPMIFDVKLMLHRDELCRSTRVQKRIRRELQSQPQSEFELVPLARDYMRQHVGLMQEIISMQAPRLDEMQHYARVILAKSGMPKGAIPVIWEGVVPLAGAVDCPALDYRCHHFSFDELGFLAKLYARLKKGEISHNPTTSSENR